MRSGRETLRDLGTGWRESVTNGTTMEAPVEKKDPRPRGRDQTRNDEDVLKSFQLSFPPCDKRSGCACPSHCALLTT